MYLYLLIFQPDKFMNGRHVWLYDGIFFRPVVLHRFFLLGFLLIMQFRIIWNFSQLVKPDLLHILWLSFSIYISFSYSVCLDSSTFLVQKKTRSFFPSNVILVYSGSSLRDPQESYPMSFGISCTQNVAPDCQIRNHDGLQTPKVIRGTIPFNLTC
jgi:hypothetical protein